MLKIPAYSDPNLPVRKSVAFFKRLIENEIEPFNIIEWLRQLSQKDFKRLVKLDADNNRESYFALILIAAILCKKLNIDLGDDFNIKSLRAIVASRNLVNLVHEIELEKLGKAPITDFNFIPDENEIIDKFDPNLNPIWFTYI
jgi:hypothetical protein